MTTPTPDLFKTWKELYDRSEEFWSKPMHDMLGSESFVGWMTAVREQTLTHKQMSRENLEQYWESLRLPSKTDLARLAGQVVNLEAKVEALDDRLDLMEGKLDALFARLDVVLERLDAKATVRVPEPAAIVETEAPKSKRPAK
jgi:polyhydroxyalkanoic acid synthase PhaR subunit